MEIEAIRENGDAGRRFGVPLLNSLRLVINTFRKFGRTSIPGRKSKNFGAVITINAL